MSYQNFKPDFWSKYIQGELGKLCVLHEDCDYTFEGEIKYGERIKILGVGRPTIGDYTGEDIGDPEKIAERTQEYEDRFANPFVAAQRGYIDEVIYPHSTRRRIALGLRKLRNKQLENPWKKHDNIPL